MEAKDVKSLQEAYASMYNTSEESQTEVISETVVRTGPDGKPVFPHSKDGPTEIEVRRDMRAGKKPAKSTPPTRAGMKPAKPAPRADTKPAPSTRAPKKPSPAPRADTKPAPSTRADKQMKEESSIDEGIMGALKKVGKAVLGPADQSPEAEAARMGKRRGPGTPKKQQPASMKEDADVFDIVKDYLMTEHDATEEEALKVMLELTAEERTAIVEGTPADRARRAVKNQRDGYYGDDHALTKEMEATKAAVARLRKA